MNIDHDTNGNPRAMLVSVSPSEAPQPNGKHLLVMIPIAEIIKLRHVDRPLVGHPWLDVPQKEIIGIEISKHVKGRLDNHTARGRFVAVRAVAVRGVHSRGAKIGGDDMPLVDYRFSWRDQCKYITDPVDVAWLSAFSETSHDYAAKMFLVGAIGEYFERLYTKMAAMKPAKRKKVRAKDRRGRQ